MFNIKMIMFLFITSVICIEAADNTFVKREIYRDLQGRLITEQQARQLHMEEQKKQAEAERRRLIETGEWQPGLPETETGMDEKRKFTIQLNQCKYRAT